MERLGIKKIDGEYPRVILYNNDNKLEGDEVVNVSRIEGKIRKIQ